MLFLSRAHIMQKLHCVKVCLFRKLFIGRLIEFRQCGRTTVILKANIRLALYQYQLKRQKPFAFFILSCNYIRSDAFFGRTLRLYVRPTANWFFSIASKLKIFLHILSCSVFGRFLFDTTNIDYRFSQTYSDGLISIWFQNASCASETLKAQIFVMN